MSEKDYYKQTYFADDSDDPYVIVTPDGKVLVNPKFTAEEAAKVFWQAVTMSGYNPRNAVLLECAEYLRLRAGATGSVAADAELAATAATFESWVKNG